MPDDFIIDAQNLTKVYNPGESEVRALDGVSFNVRKGEFVSIMGSSGSGKSTLLHILGCLDQPTSGTILIDGHDIGKMDSDGLAEIRRKKIGFIFQMFNLLARINALQNVELPLIYSGVEKEESRQRAIKSLEMVGLGKRMGHNPNEMSGGQQQRVAIARALINNPAMILADEPTGNLDSRSGTEIITILKKLHSEGHTLVIVTHDVNMASIAQRGIVIKDGKIIEEKTF
jgi:putative ABC transport system ATP-binding protein